ncbi:hypothetical protein LshimejAT787_1203240 [Lyophyllum shimeji]|uniref:Uncharacterized protein n=1 Tax=Lyophyllum shimeji TaxID=47721 RepID=A0A9P3PVN7_LYOSH|nr:hypothetical protein LshimejAT787_1203240 [Lyophyllum shimeji]
MAEQVCAICITACCDVFAGICVDFASLRHAFTENLCRCNCGKDEFAAEAAEREPLIPERLSILRAVLGILFARVR